MDSELRGALVSELISYVRQQGEHVSFYELQEFFRNKIPVRGDRAWRLGPRHYIWAGLSSELAEVLRCALSFGLIFPHPCGVFTYIRDGGAPGDIEIVDESTGEKKKLKWQPLTFCSFPNEEVMAA